MQKKFSLIALAAVAFGVLAANQANAGVTTVPSVDLARYLGTWFEVASIPQSFQRQCVGNTTAEYSIAEKGRIRVLNSCSTASGERSVAEGRAEATDSSNAKLKVTFVKLGDWVFAFGGNYWILDLAPDYSYALIGDPSAQYAWILSRTPTVSPSLLANAERKFRAEGYDTCKILTSIQSRGNQQRVPLCKLTSDGDSTRDESETN